MTPFNIMAGDTEPIPTPGDQFTSNQIRSGEKCEIRACDCYGGGNSTTWPNGPVCGAHLHRLDGVSEHCLCFKRRWLFSGILFRLGPLKIENEPRNNDGRADCFWCKVSTQKRGGGRYDVCPKCGK